jgi:radical SAM superfamily enzyme YgiQ (UPF0313 family)
VFRCSGSAWSRAEAERYPGVGEPGVCCASTTVCRLVRQRVQVFPEWAVKRSSTWSLLPSGPKWDLLELMRKAAFGTVFCGIETPDPAALRAMAKEHNMMVPLIEGVQTLNRYGMEVVSGIILGLDTDTPRTGTDILGFIESSQIPMLTINLLQALPKTPLWDRLQREGRLIEDVERESNIEFRLPYEQVLAVWRDCMARAYAPEAVYARYDHQARKTYPNRLKLPNSPQRTSWRKVRRGLHLLRRILWEVGIRSHYRREFWKFAWPRLVRGEIDVVIGVAMVAHHLIMFAREALQGRHNASHYSTKLREVPIAAE